MTYIQRITEFIINVNLYALFKNNAIILATD